VLPIVHLRRRGGSRATIELRGDVATVWLRYPVLRATEREAATSAAWRWEMAQTCNCVGWRSVSP